MTEEKITPTRWSASRRFVTGSAAAVAAVVASHGLAAIVRGLGATSPPLASLELTLGAIVVALVGAALLPHRAAPVAGGLAGGLVAAVTQWTEPGAWPLLLVLPAVGFGVGLAARRFGGRLPSNVDNAWSRRRIAAISWALLATVAVVQTGRLATYVTDPDTDFVVGTSHPFWNGHQCLPAYLHGAELALWGEENIYDPGHYFHHAEAPRTEIEGLSVEDPYQYPPQFLLLPLGALELTRDLTLLRVGWFVLDFSLFVGTYGLLALWIGGPAGRLALWLLPGVLSSFPFLYTFQYGQFHLAAICLSVLGMLAFARRRRATGGLLLAFAVLAKLFPVVLLVPLAVQRKFRELAWTAGWVAVLTVATLAVLGTTPFVSFMDYHLPRLGSGAAFAFDEAFPELAEMVIADNQGVFGLVTKLGLSKGVASAVGRTFTVGLLVLAAVAGRRFAGASRWARGSLWLALLGLGSLASPGAWGDYVPAAAVWLLALVAVRAVEDRRLGIPLAAVAAFQFFLLGTMPVAGWHPPEVMIPISAVGAASMLALFGIVAFSKPERWRSRSYGALTDPVASDPEERAA